MAPLKYTLDQRIAAFWAKANKQSGHWWNELECWFWIASFGTSGYGQFYDGERLVGAHCFAYTLTHGPIPKGQQVLHHCDNRACVRPEHLFAGTQAVNMADMWAKGRGASPRAKLTQADRHAIRALREDGLSCRAISERFDVCPMTISNLLRGKHYRQD